MRDNFDRCMEEVFKHEGGYVWHKDDPGGETNLGISRRSYPNEDIRGMTRARAAFLYRRDFWDAVQGDDLPAGLDLVAFDAAVNSGVLRGVRWLQGAVGAVPDGKMGPKTLAAAQRADAATAIDRALEARMVFLRGLRTFSTFGRGWTRRVDSVRAVARQMALQNPAPAPVSGKTTFIDVIVRFLRTLFGGKA